MPAFSALVRGQGGLNRRQFPKAKEPGAHTQLFIQKCTASQAALALASQLSVCRTQCAAETTSSIEPSYAKTASSVPSSGDGFRNV